MRFDNINFDNDCNCLKDSFENTEDIFTRKLRKQNLSELDFKSYWEKGKYRNETDCKKICLSKGVSIHIIKDDNETQVIKIYQETFKISPGMKKYYCKFKLLSNAGQVKPSHGRNSKWHFTFYKCDQFTMEKIEILNILPLG